MDTYPGAPSGRAGVGHGSAGHVCPMPEEPGLLVEAITAAVREGDDRRIDLLLHRFKNLADVADLIRLHRRLCGPATPRRP